MKTILILTDFSINADYTAHYALKFAQKIKANLLLCNIYATPVNEVRKESKQWPLSSEEENSIEDLGEITARLKTIVDTGEKTDFKPEIDQCSQEGFVKGSVKHIASSNDFIMAIISMHSTRSFTSFFSPNHAWEIIEQANFPVLVIPYQVKFKNYKTIAFATDMTVTDKYVLNSIVGLAKYSDADILISHVANNGLTVQDEETQLKQFFNKDSTKESSPAILYQAIKSSSVTTALKELAQDIAIDMLVLIKRPHSTLQKIFERNVIRRLANHPAKPLLIFPDTNVMERLPVF